MAPIDKLRTKNKGMGLQLTAALVQQLNAQGYRYSNEIGMYSARLSTDYVPCVNLSAI